VDATMAKKRSPKNKERKDPSGVRTIAFRASLEYAEWLELAAKHNRITVAGFIDQALARHAEATGVPAPPPERVP
jgi:uncharacterized protein (DUF1778 family)